VATVFIGVVLRLVIRPVASTLTTGMEFADPYEPDAAPVRLVRVEAFPIKYPADTLPL
jgi:hypothetical protein